LYFSAGGIVPATQFHAGKATGLVSVLRMKLQTQKVAHVYETGWWGGVDNKYLHVFCTKYIVLFQVADPRSETVLEYLANASRTRSAAMGTRDTIFSKRHVATRTQGIAFAI
jgi:hypothetical protein